MDIKIPNETITGRPVATQFGDLLAQLRIAGTIEAEVVKQLQGKLLLNSRLGQILTTNSLSYRPGDRLDIRLVDSEQGPILKASPRRTGPVTLDSAQNPRLLRALPADRSMLAVVTRTAAQRTEIKLADQVLTLPRLVGVARNQLLSLRRIDAERSIEVTPADRKLIYRALLKQLVPSQAERQPTGLVKLLNLVSKAVTVPASKPLATPESVVKPGSETVIGKQPIPEARQTSSRMVTAPPLPAGKAQTASASGSEAIRTNAKVGATEASIQPASANKSSAGKTPPATNSPQVSALLRQINKTSKKSLTSASPVKALVQNSVSSAKPSQPGTTRTATDSAPIANKTGSTSSGAGQAAPATNTATASSSRSQPALAIPSQAGVVAPQTAVSNASSPPANSAATGNNPASAAPTVLQSLLLLVPGIADLDANRIKQWFEYAKLVRTADPRPGLTPATEPLKVLKQLGDEHRFNNELTRALQTGTRSQAGEESPAAKPPPPENLLQLVREGIKLVEQSLSQNLLQRASLGMQQETQQPLSLSFALPFLDQQEIKPLQIELAQRDQPQQERDNGWDIRLSFEFSGLGLISCHLFLESSTVAASFYSEQEQTRHRIEQALPQLREQLTSAGFTPGDFHSFVGEPTQKNRLSANAYSESLIDIEV